MEWLTQINLTNNQNIKRSTRTSVHGKWININLIYKIYSKHKNCAHIVLTCSLRVGECTTTPYPHTLRQLIILKAISNLITRNKGKKLQPPHRVNLHQKVPLMIELVCWCNIPMMLVQPKIRSVKYKPVSYRPPQSLTL